MDRKTEITEGYEQWYGREFFSSSERKIATQINIGPMFAYWYTLIPLEFRSEYDWKCDNENDLFNLLVSRIKEAESDKVIEKDPLPGFPLPGFTPGLAGECVREFVKEVGNTPVEKINKPNMLKLIKKWFSKSIRGKVPLLTSRPDPTPGPPPKLFDRYGLPVVDKIPPMPRCKQAKKPE